MPIGRRPTMTSAAREELEPVTNRGPTARAGYLSRHVRLQRIERAVDRYLADCYRRRTAATVKELAQFLRLSRPYLSRAVVGVSSVALRELMRRKQAARAEELLRLTRLSVHEITRRCAFGDVKTLYRAFRKTYGTLPGAY